jgi:hypothetical protein
MKTCSKCKQDKQLSEFYKEKRTKDGRTSECKKCFGIRCKNYIQTEQGREVHRRASSKYEKSEKGKVVRKKICIRHSKARKAGSAVNGAIQSGLIPNAKFLRCNYCPNSAQEYHHYKGYAKEHWLDVLPTCIKCHRKEHKKVA